MLNNFDPETNFWVHNPQLKVAFKSIYQGDESKNKFESSNLMWAIALMWHPDSKFRGVKEKERKKMVEDELLGINDDKKGERGRRRVYQWSEHKKDIERFKQLCLTKAQRFLALVCYNYL